MAFVDPTDILERSHIGEGMRLADFGAGTGAWSIAAAKLVGTGGKVVAVEIQKDLVSTLAKNAQDARVSLEVLWGDLEKVGGSKIGDASVDAVIVANTFFQVKKKEVFVEEIARVLRPGGTVLLVEWSESFGGLGPQSADVVPQFAAEKYFSKGGFVMEREIAAGDHHYGIIFRKQTS